MDGTTATVALFALCAVNLALIWQVATLSDSVDDVQEDIHATVRWLARMEAYRLRVAGRQKDGDGDGEEEETGAIGQDAEASTRASSKG